MISEDKVVFAGIIPYTIIYELEPLLDDGVSNWDGIDTFMSCLYHQEYKSLKHGAKINLLIPKSELKTTVDELRYRSEQARYFGSVSKQQFDIFNNKLDNLILGKGFVVTQKEAAKPLGDDSQGSAKRAEVESWISAAVEEATNLLARAQSPVRYKKEILRNKRVRIRWSGKISRGGKRGISIAPLPEIMSTNFIEYDRIKKLKDIGSFEGNLQTRIFALIAHEMAHVAQYSYEEAINLEIVPSALKQPHGLGWQEIYRYLRVNMVNHRSDYRVLNQEA